MAGRGEGRRERLVDAAEAVFTREGLRGASMERIAAEAGVARATVYAYFTDKEDAFRQVCARLAQRFEDVVAAALAGPGEPAARVRAALLAKHEMAFGVARLSPHAADLLAAKDRLAGPVFAEADARIVARVADELAALGVARAQEAAALVFAAAHGVAEGCSDAESLRHRIARTVDAVLLGLTQERKEGLLS